MEQLTFWSLAGELVTLTFQSVVLAHNHQTTPAPFKKKKKNTGPTMFFLNCVF